MNDLAENLNDAIAEESPALGRLLSPLGRQAVFPPDIPFQAAEARGTSFNGTIGQITDGAGQAIPVPSLAGGLDALPPDRRNRALLYSPVEGMADLRERWRRWQRRDVEHEVPSTLPQVTVGLTHGLSLVADIFGGRGRAVAVAAPFWGNYRQAFALRTGARIVTAPAYIDGAYNCDAIAEALVDEPEGEPCLAILNLPSNPGGYSLTPGERENVARSLCRVADDRPLLVVCDDAYAGLVYEETVPRRSMYFDLVGLHPNLVPVKVDGATKEVAFFGGRVGFLTFPVSRGSEAEAALESKVKCLLRGTLGSPVASSQVLLLEALESDGLAAEVESVRRLLEARYLTLREALEGIDRELLTPLPFNSGCFALLELREETGLTAEEVRLHLLEEHDTGLVAIPPRFLRIAFCSVADDAIPELVRRLGRGVQELARRI